MRYLDRPCGPPRARRLARAPRIVKGSIRTGCQRGVNRVTTVCRHLREARIKWRSGFVGPCANSRVGFDAPGTASEVGSPVPWPGRTTRLGGGGYFCPLLGHFHPAEGDWARLHGAHLDAAPGEGRSAGGNFRDEPGVSLHLDTPQPCFLAAVSPSTVRHRRYPRARGENYSPARKSVSGGLCRGGGGARLRQGPERHQPQGWV